MRTFTTRDEIIYFLDDQWLDSQERNLLNMIKDNKTMLEIASAYLDQSIRNGWDGNYASSTTNAIMHLYTIYKGVSPDSIRTPTKEDIEYISTRSGIFKLNIDDDGTISILSTKEIITVLDGSDSFEGWLYNDCE